MTVPNDREKDPLLDDEQFSQLMQAEFERQQAAEDRVAKERTWRAIRSRIGPQRSFGHVWSWAAGIALVALLLPWLWTPMHDERLKGIDDTPIRVRLSAFVLGDQGRLTPAGDVLQSGATLLFKTHSDHNAFGALVLLRNTQAPELRFKAALIAGDAQLLQKDAKAYGYMIEPSDRELRFCLLGAAKPAGLQQQLQQILNSGVTPAMLGDPDACVAISIQQPAVP